MAETHSDHDADETYRKSFNFQQSGSSRDYVANPLQKKSLSVIECMGPCLVPKQIR